MVIVTVTVVASASKTVRCARMKGVIPSAGKGLLSDPSDVQAAGCCLGPLIDQTTIENEKTQIIVTLSEWSWEIKPNTEICHQFSEHRRCVGQCGVVLMVGIDFGGTGGG